MSIVNPVFTGIYISLLNMCSKLKVTTQDLGAILKGSFSKGAISVGSIFFSNKAVALQVTHRTQGREDALLFLFFCIHF